MNDFVPRIDSAVTVDRAVPARVVPAITAVQPSAASAGSASEGGVGADNGREARNQSMASAADFAKVHARIAAILADMKKGSSSVHVSADSAMDALLPQSTIIVPLPPATTEAIERAVRVARDMVRQAELSRSSHAGISASTVSQIVTPDIRVQ